MINEKLVEEISNVYENAFNNDYMVVRSPGRINIIGEHTDYNDGFVLPAAIDKACYIALGPRNDREINLIAQDLNETFSVGLDVIQPVETGWPNYILGVVAQFLKLNIDVPGFNAVISSDVPVGAGLSSSAALECAVAYALNTITGSNLDRITLVKMAQQAEHEYAGVMCGIMDQFASMMGKKGHLIQLDCRSLVYSYIPIDLKGYNILLLNTNVKHSLASSEYNTRRQECKQAVAWVKEHLPEVSSLRDVTEEMLDLYVKPKDLTIDARARYVVQEIQRLITGCEDLKQGNIHALGQKMKETHRGLSKMYQVSCIELDYLADAVDNMKSVVGCRMMGGGFGGCTINLVEEQATEDIIHQLKDEYEKDMHLPLTYYVTSIEDGTNILKSFRHV